MIFAVMAASRDTPVAARDTPVAARDTPAASRDTRARVASRLEGVMGDARLAAQLEVLLHIWAVRTCKRDGIPCYWVDPAYRYRYTTRALSLEYNLKHARDGALLGRVVSGELPLKQFAGMTPVEMWPERWEDAFQKVATRQLRREADADASRAPDGAYTCGRCKSKKTVYTSIQIRSADEPMTTFCRCLSCGKSWKD